MPVVVVSVSNVTEQELTPSCILAMRHAYQRCQRMPHTSQERHWSWLAATNPLAACKGRPARQVGMLHVHISTQVFILAEFVLDCVFSLYILICSNCFRFMPFAVDCCFVCAQYCSLSISRDANG